MGEVEVLGPPGQVPHHLGDVGQALVLNKIYAEKNKSLYVDVRCFLEK